jgi:hypothetical protein
MKAGREILTEIIVENRTGVNQLIRNRNATKEFNLALIDKLSQMLNKIDTLQNRIDELNREFLFQ